MDFGRIYFEFCIMFTILFINCDSGRYKIPIRNRQHFFYEPIEIYLNSTNFSSENTNLIDSDDSLENAEYNSVKLKQQPQQTNGQFVSIGNNEYVFVPGPSTAATTKKPNSDIFDGSNESDEQEEEIKDTVRYSGAQLWKVHVMEVKHYVIRKLKKYYGGQIWDMNRDGIDIFFDNDSSAAKAKEYIDTTDVTYNIMIEDIHKAIEDTYKAANLTSDEVPWLRNDELLMTWDQYHDLEVFDEFYYYIIEKFPKMSQLLTIGRSHEKRELRVLKISNGNPDNLVIFIDSGMQGREWIGPAGITLAISRLLYNYKSKPLFMKNIDWYFLPILNPDGYEYSRTQDRLWTKNRRKNRLCEGVNLDRNFNYQWGKKGSMGDPCSNFYRGPERLSEPEALALRNFILQIGSKSKLKAYISIGSYGQMITYPWGDDDFVPKNHQMMNSLGKKAIRNIRKATGGEYQIGSSYGMKFARSGNSADWVMDNLGPIYVFNFYLRDQGRYGYLLPPTFIIQSGFDVFEMMKTVAQTVIDERDELIN